MDLLIISEQSNPMKTNGDREQFFNLMQRFVQLGQLLPDDLADTDAEIVLAEMRSTKAKIDALMNEYSK
jgi:hypothetical protein